MWRHRRERGLHCRQIRTALELDLFGHLYPQGHHVRASLWLLEGFIPRRDLLNRGSGTIRARPSPAAASQPRKMSRNRAMNARTLPSWLRVEMNLNSVALIRPVRLSFTDLATFLWWTSVFRPGRLFPSSGVRSSESCVGGPNASRLLEVALSAAGWCQHR
jgi:hypothetical protein